MRKMHYKNQLVIMHKGAIFLLQHTDKQINSYVSVIQFRKISVIQDLPTAHRVWKGKMSLYLLAVINIKRILQKNP
jgi:hypothetical protein